MSANATRLSILLSNIGRKDVSKPTGLLTRAIAFYLNAKVLNGQLMTHVVIQALKGEMHAKPIGTKNKILIARDVKLAPTRDGSKVVVGSGVSGKNMQLIKAITRSFLWNEQLLSGERKTVKEIADQEKIQAPTYVSRVMHLRFLAPDIIESILDGNHPADWTVEKLFAIKSTNWQDQRKALGLI